MLLTSQLIRDRQGITLLERKSLEEKNKKKVESEKDRVPSLENTFFSMIINLSYNVHSRKENAVKTEITHGENMLWLQNII